MSFQDRRQAGRELGEALARSVGHRDLLVLGMLRDGVLVASEVADQLEAPLDVFAVRKLLVPGHEELAMGAIATGGIQLIDDEVIARMNVGDPALAAVVAQELRELRRLERTFRTHRVEPDVRGRTVVLVDDGLATGTTIRAAIAAVRRMGAAEVVVAVPVADAAAVRAVEKEADVVVCLERPPRLRSLTEHYETLPPVTDDDVSGVLDHHRGRHPQPPEVPV